MLEFPCPTCGKRVEGDDTFAGKHVVCPACHATVIAPQPTASAISGQAPLPAHSSATAISEGLPPDDAPLPAIHTPHLFWRTLPFVIIVAVIATAIGLMIPAVVNVQTAAKRTQSVSNLKQIGVGAHSFYDVHKRLPFNGVAPAVANDPTSGSWAFQMLPWIDQQALFDRPNPDVGIQGLMCPGRGRPMKCTTGAWSDYCINPWLNDHLNGAVNTPDVKRTLEGITDGTSNTIFCGHGSIDPHLYASEIAIIQSVDIFKGGSAATARQSTTNEQDTRGDRRLKWGGPFPEGALMCWCDATIRPMPYITSGGVITKGISTFKCCWEHDGPDCNQGLGKFLTPCGQEICRWHD